MTQPQPDTDLSMTVIDWLILALRLFPVVVLALVALGRPRKAA